MQDHHIKLPQKLAVTSMFSLIGYQSPANKEARGQRAKVVTLSTVLRSSTEEEREARGAGGLSQVPASTGFIGRPVGQFRDRKTLC